MLAVKVMLQQAGGGQALTLCSNAVLHVTRHAH